LNICIDVAAKGGRAQSGIARRAVGNQAMRLKKLLLLVSLFVAGCVVVPAGRPPAEAIPSASPDEVATFAELVNAHRRKAGCKPLIWVREVAVVAQTHSENMYRHNFFDHVDQNGHDPFQRLQGAHIRYRLAAENIAAGQWTADMVLEAWLSSAGHRRNIENCALLEHGVGLSHNRWTHLLVTRR
jgi:uncharacterized protein YkwD